MSLFHKDNLFQSVKFNHFWSFLKEPIDTNLNEISQKISQFENVTLPHDWLIYNSHNLYETSSGWYRKEFHMDKEDDCLYFLRFEGVYMDSVVYCNGKFVGQWKNGYTTFEFEITKHLHTGKNTLIVLVRNLSPNSRWYSGAGIYRDVWFIKKQKNHIQSDGIYVHTTNNQGVWTIEVETETAVEKPAMLKQAIYDQGQLISESVKPVNRIKNTQMLQVTNPELWSFDYPKLYRLETSLYVDGTCCDQVSQNIGFKDLVLDPAKGMILNGVSVKINGVCEHHDLGSLGSAFHRSLMKERMLQLKQMGVNAIRTAHSVPAPAVMELADELGFLVYSEAFDMWERPKTKNDYSRFFSEWAEIDVQSWVRRDRNHVSLFMWSIGNEIYDTHVDKHGLDITKQLYSYVKKHDPKGNGAVTIASNFMTGTNAQSCTDIVKYAGYNYLERLYEPHHKEHPDWIIYGSETGSVVQSRGVYHFPLDVLILADDDLQCSSLGNSVTSWGSKSIGHCITGDRDIPFSLGQFIWTGFDYIGEPTPYDTKNSYFGQIDTAGFEKDSFYVYQSAWTKPENNPMIHIFPYWQFNEGQIIDVRVCTNTSSFALFLNDQLIGHKDIDMSKDLNIIPTWKLPFTKGELKAISYDKAGNEIARCVRHSFGDPSRLIVSVDKDTIQANGEDIAQITIQAVDVLGHIVEDCKLPVIIEVEGAGVLLGIDNGDSTDFDSYKGNTKRMFSGKLKVLVGSIINPGKITVHIKTRDLPTQTITIFTKEVSLPYEASVAKTIKHYLRSGEGKLNSNTEISDFIPIERIELFASNHTLTKEENEIEVMVQIHPENATKQKYTWKAVTDKGVISNIGKVKSTSAGCSVHAIGDGIFYLRCMVENQKGHPDVISQLEFTAKNLGIANKNPYEFVSAGLYDRSIGEIGAGNEKGISTDNMDTTTVFYDYVDFGNFGSDMITLSIFAFDGKPQEIEMYEIDDETKTYRLIDTLIYDIPTIWNKYQDKTYHLTKRLSGLKTIAFVFHTRNHFKGFRFESEVKAYQRLSILDCNSYYGDQVTPELWGMSNIGNNVSFLFEDMDFNGAVNHLILHGKSISDKNTIRIQSTDSDGNRSFQNIEFLHTEEFETKEFDIEPIDGKTTIEFIFLPGSHFDFKWFQFVKK